MAPYSLENPVEVRPRDPIIDRYRGFLVILMVAGDFIAGVDWIPNSLKHAPDIGFTIADFVAPAFVFLIGLNYEPSFLRRYKENASAAYRHFLMRYLSLIGIGAIITGGAQLVDRPTGWGVLESLGVAGLLTLAVIRLPIWARAITGLFLLGFYQYALDNGMLQSVLSQGHGGFFGSLSWTALLILSTVVAKIWQEKSSTIFISLIALTVITMVASTVIPISKNRVSLSYVLLTLSLSVLALLIAKALSKLSSNKEGILCWWGRNSLALYLIHLLLLAPFGLPEMYLWYAGAPPWLTLAQLLAILSLMSLIAHRMFLKKVKN